MGAGVLTGGSRKEEVKNMWKLKNSVKLVLEKYFTFFIF